jgi:hypothetical protein
MEETMNAFARCFLAALACGLLSAGAHAAGPIPLTSCGKISAPGSYVLVDNVVAAGDCFIVIADDVTIDFGGFVLTGDTTGRGVAMSGGWKLTLRNGTIQRFATGIALFYPSVHDVPGNVIERMRVSDNGSYGVSGGSAVVRDSVFTGNGNAGISLFEGSVVTSNRVAGNGIGIEVFRGARVVGNLALSNKGPGIGAMCPSLVTGNTSTDNSPNLVISGSLCYVEGNVAP